MCFVRRWKLFLLPVLLLFGQAVYSEGQIRSKMVTVFGGVHHLFSYGDVSEYLPGENDFPVTPGHTPALAGLSFSILGRIGFEIEACWVGTSLVTMADPTDGDTIEVQAGPRSALSVGFIFLPFRGQVRPYLSVGGGLDMILSKDAVYTSKFGYSISVPAPRGKDRFDPEVFAGGGLFFDVGRNFGVRFDTRYVWILDDPKSVRGIRASAGLFLVF